MYNHLTKKQEEFFLDVYRTSLGALLSTHDKMDAIGYNSVINDAARIAAKSVDLFMAGFGMKPMDEIIDKIENTRIDTPFEFPKVNQETES